MALSSTVGGPAGQRHPSGLLLGDGHRDRLCLRVGAGLLVGGPWARHRLASHLPEADDLGPGPDGRALALGVLRDMLDEVVDARIPALVLRPFSHGFPPNSPRAISGIPDRSPEFPCPPIHHTPGKSSRLHCYKDMVIPVRIVAGAGSSR